MGIRSTLKKKEKKNKGGVVGGAGYLLGSAAAGVAGVGEGIVDLGLALGADLTGNHRLAEYVFKDNVVGDWHADITEEYNPDSVMKFGGDVAHGLGQSSWFLLSLIPGAQWLGPTVFGTGMVGQGISSAAEVTGDVGVKEAAYGVTTAALETGLEVALGGMGKAAKVGIGAAAKKTGKQTLKAIASSATRKGLASKLFSAAAGEFAEEFISEYADTFLQKMYQIDPNKEYSLKDALYAGAVGAVSGGISGGSAAVIDTTVNQQRGARILANGNAQTLVNTANLVADKIAGAGTEFKNAPEWVTRLRGEVDAYNKLVEKGQGDSLSAQTILGEMQASLFFAETQAIHSGIVEEIKNSGEDDRAALAEYINLSIDKSKRKKDYTAEDIANDTDEVTKQLATLNLAGARFFNYDTAIADMEREGAIENKITTERESATARAAEEAQSAESGRKSAEAQVEGEPLAATPQAAQMGAAEGGSAVVNEAVGAEATQMGAAASTTGAAVAQEATAAAPGVSKAAMATEGEVKADLAPRMPRIRSTLKTASKRAAVESGALVEGEETKYSVAVKKKAIAKTRENAAREERRASKMAHEAQEATQGTEEQRSAKIGSEAKDGGKAAEKSGDRRNESSEIKISEPRESMTDAQRKEKARKRAEQWIEWEKKSAPSAKELNAAREYVKGFDNIENTRRLAIVRMIRSAEGKVDKKTLKGVANLIAAMPKADVEIRFAEGLGDLGGFYAPKVGGKALIVIDSSTNFKKTIQGTIAHELMHHLEKKAGYKAFAKYVMSHVKAEKKAEIEEAYTEFYTDKYTADAEERGLSEAEIKAYVEEKLSSEEFKALIESEVVAKYVGEALNNEKLLKKYADKDKKFIAKVGEWLFEKVTNLKKDKDVNREVVEIAEEMAFRVSVLAQGTDTVGESKSGTRYEIKYPRFTQKEIGYNIKTVATMQSVITISEDNLKPTGKAPSVLYEEYFKSLGENIYSEIYGDIAIKKSSTRSEIRHGNTAEKIASMEAIPTVIDQGKVIAILDKGAGVERLVIAAPIVIGKTDYLMGVMLQRDAQNQRLYLHNVVLKEKTTNSQEVDLLTTGTYNENDRLFITSILQKVLSVNTSEEKNITKADLRETKYEIDDDVRYDVVNPTTSSKNKKDLRFGKYGLKKGEKITDSDRANDEGFKKSVERSKDEEQKRKEKEKKAKEAVEALFLNEVRTYTKTDFKNAFSRAGEIAESVIGEILNGRRVSISGADLTRVVSDVYIAMYKASYDGDVGAVDAVKKIADKAAAYFIKNQAVWDSDTKRYVSLTKYIEDADTLKKYEEALA